MASSTETDLKDYREFIAKNFGKTSGILVEDPENIVIEKFDTGSYLLTADLKGGWAKGTLIEIYGTNGSGKTTLCASGVAAHQKKYPDELILWIDLEKVFDPVYFKQLGIDISPDKFLLMRPDTGEQAWELIINFAKKFQKGAVVLDSVALLLPVKEDEGQVGDAQMAAAARMNSQGLRKLFPYMGFGKTTVFAINQIRKNIGGYGDPNVTTGGEAWAFYARTRINTSSSKGEAGEYANHKFKQVKSNYGNRDYVTETSIDYGFGFNKMKELLSLAVDEGIVKKSGSWYSYEDSKLGQGADSVTEVLNQNPDLTKLIEEQLIEKGLL